MSARLDSAGVGKVLRLLHTLVAYGRNLVQTLRQHNDPDDLPWYPFLTGIFGTANPALITVTIIRGLLRAAALQARLCESVAPLRPFPLQQDRIAKRIDGGRGQRPRRTRAVGWAIPPGWPAEVPSLDRLPTPEEEMFAEIAAQDQDRPLGAILLDICLDLGIVPAQMDPAAWDELRLALTLYGADPARLTSRWANPDADPALGRKSEAHSAADTPGPRGSPAAGDTPIVFPPWAAPSPQSPARASTGPP